MEKKRLAKAGILGILTAALGVAISLTPFGAMLEENIGLDALFTWRGAATPPTEVAVITIDKTSSGQLGLPNNPAKWPRAHHARLIDNLVRQGARVIAFDILFTEPRETEGDQSLARAIGAARNVVLVEALKREAVTTGGTPIRNGSDTVLERLIPSLPLFTDSALATAPFPLPKVPVRVSRFWTFKTGAGETPTLPAVALQIYALPAYNAFRALIARAAPSHATRLPSDQANALRTGIVPLAQMLRALFTRNPALADEMRQILDNQQHPQANLLRALINLYSGVDYPYLNFYGPPHTVTTLSYHAALQLTEQPLPHFKDKVVFVGFSESLQQEQKDGFYTVFSQEDSGLDVSGVEIAATAFANLLQARPVQPAGPMLYLGILLGWGLLFGAGCRLLPLTFTLSSGTASIITYAAFAAYQFETTALWLPLVIPLLLQAPFALAGATLWRHIDTQRERHIIHTAFGHYLPSAVVDEIAKGSGNIAPEGRLVHGVCLCTDAAQYTTLAETLDPARLQTLMNDYYKAIFTPVRERGGIISDVVGDAMLALWTDPAGNIESRRQACQAALDIAHAVDFFNNTSSHPSLPTRIGLHSGDVMLGNIGAVDHYEYRAVGDIVNTATRIQTLNKQLGTKILVSDDILKDIDAFLIRKLGIFPLAGKSRSVAICELLCRIEDATELQQQICGIFGVGLAAFREQRWHDAAENFSTVLRLDEQDGPAHFYLALCNRDRHRRRSDPMHGIFPANISEKGD
ncbi:MAG: CHASE2 domain-containing protein [Pseudomonadota bacterium]